MSLQKYIDAAKAMQSALPHSSEWLDAAEQFWQLNAEDIAALLLEADALLPRWRPIEEAPHGEPGWSVGSRASSEWFIALAGSSGRQHVVRRVYDQGHSFECTGDGHYSEKYFTHFMSLPGGPK